MEHVLKTHTNCRISNCPICDGGLALCTVCHGAEASLPTECPGRALTPDEESRIQAGTLDFVQGEWKSTKEEGVDEYDGETVVLSEKAQTRPRKTPTKKFRMELPITSTDDLMTIQKEMLRRSGENLV